MKPTVIKKKPRDVANILRPTLYCEMGSEFDLPTKITIDPDHWRYHRRLPMYYRVMEKDNVQYGMYAIYHYYDKAARHRADFQGCITAYHRKDGLLWSACISHFNILFTDKPDLTFVIGAGGHSWRHGNQPEIKYPVLTFNRPEHFQLINMDSYRFGYDWEWLEKAWNPSVHSARQWFDIKLEQYVREKMPEYEGERYVSTKKLFWENPPALFEFAKMKGIVK